MTAASEMKKNKLCTKQYDTSDPVDGISSVSGLSGDGVERHNQKVSMVSK